MRIANTFWATAAFAAAGVGFYAGSGSYKNPEIDLAVIPACSEESDGPRLFPAEAIDLSCVEPVLPFDLFAHTSEPPLAGPALLPNAVVPAGYDVPDSDGPVLPHIIPAGGSGSVPAELPMGFDASIDLGGGKPPSGEKPPCDEHHTGAGATACPAGQKPCAEPKSKPKPAVPDGWLGPE